MGHMYPPKAVAYSLVAVGVLSFLVLLTGFAVGAVLA